MSSGLAKCVSAEPDAAPDRGCITAFRGILSHQQPRQVSWVVMCQDRAWVSMSTVALIDDVIEDRTSFKKVGPQLELLPPDQEAADRLVAAYRDGRIPGWLAAYLLGCVGHVAGYETGKSILLSNHGKSYAGVALVKMDKVRAYDDLRQVIFSDHHPKIRRDAGYGLAVYRSADAINDFLKAYDEGRLFPLNHVAYNVARCGPTDTTLLGLLRSQDSRKQKLAFAVIEWLIAENLQLRPLGKEVAAALRPLLQEADVTMASHRRERLSAWANSV
jgi:hypothetical protein